MIRSPLYYSGDKYKTLDLIIENLPIKLKEFIDPFVGGGSLIANINAEKITISDSNNELIQLHKMFFSYESGEKLLEDVVKIAKTYNLSTSFEKKYAVNGNKKFFSDLNKESHRSLRQEYNKTKEPLLLFVLIIYSYNRLLRFNKKSEYNVPVGTLDLNKNVAKHIVEFINAIKQKKIIIKNEDAFKIISAANRGSCLFIDPPYLVSNAEYNNIWDEEKEEKLYKLLDKKIEEGCVVLVTNFTYRNEKVNPYFLKWSKKYKNIKMNTFYFSHHNNKGANFEEVLVIGGYNGKKI